MKFVDEFGKVFSVDDVTKFEVGPAEEEENKFAVFVTTKPDARHQITRAFDDEEFADEVMADIFEKLDLTDIGSVVEEAMNA